MEEFRTCVLGGRLEYTKSMRFRALDPSPVLLYSVT